PFASASMDLLLQDLRYAVRALLRSPAFTLAAVLAVALGVGANTAMFSVVNTVLLRELPYRDPGRLALLWEHNLSSAQQHNSVSPANFLAWRDATHSFEAMAAWIDVPRSLTGAGGDPVSVQVRHVSAEIFPILGVKTELGRPYTVAEDSPSAPRVAVIGHDLWQQRFGGRPGVVGETFSLAGVQYTVVGVLPNGFRFFTPVQLWIPPRFGPEDREWPGRYLKVIARLKPGVSIQSADAEMRLVGQRRAMEFPQFDANWTANAQPLRENLTGDVRTGLLVLLGAVGFLLVIACANVANLMLARASGRHKEIAIRASLGATRGRLVRQLLTESVLLSLVASLVGLGLAALGTRAIVALIPATFPAPAITDVGIDGLVLAFTLVVALLTGVAFGIVPALSLSRGGLHDTLKEGGRSGAAATRATTRLRGALVVAELSLAIVLLAGAGLMIRSFSALRHVQLGFEPSNAMVAQVSIPTRKYSSDTAQVEFFRAVEARIAALPGVRSVGAISFLPLTGERSASDFSVPGRPIPPKGSEPVGDMRAVTPGYFQAMGIPIKAGRPLLSTDVANSPSVAVVSETLARTMWPNESAVGKFIDYEWDKKLHVQIVGVAGDVHHEGVDKQPFMEIYRPLPQFVYSTMTLVVRTAGDPSAIANPLREAVRSVDRDQPVGRLEPLEAIVSTSLGTSRLSTMLFGLFGVVGLVLASVGIYGVMSYGVIQRTREFGVRMALGARPSDVRGMVVRQGAAFTAAGIVIGILGALALTRLMRTLLFAVTPSDPFTYLAIACVLGGVALLASYLPARRATKVDPVIALRDE
ncbi:MAG TPA: ABC transporter permease, partial [Gemmatimonadaceae bacterium]|nr:ABC transporter permease [Gemmatimonadaceae bacterium]